MKRVKLGGVTRLVSDKEALFLCRNGYEKVNDAEKGKAKKRKAETENEDKLESEI